MELGGERREERGEVRIDSNELFIYIRYSTIIYSLQALNVCVCRLSCHVGDFVNVTGEVCSWVI